jgi:hypothetical protein
MAAVLWWVPVTGALAGSTARPSTTVSQRQTCPVLGIDPDFLTLSGGPAVFNADGKKHAFAVTATEEEGGSNVVVLRVQVAIQDAGNPSAANATTDPSNGMQIGPATSTATVNLSVLGTATGAARSYVINWSAMFDNGIHPCSSTDAGKSPFVVTVLPAKHS